MTISIAWFRRDLRTHDHPALVAASRAADRVVPLFVVDPVLLSGRGGSSNRVWFMLESVRVLREELARRDAPLVVRIGRPEEVVPELAVQLGASSVEVSRDLGPYGRDRDHRVVARLARERVAFHAHRGNVIHEPEEVRTLDGRASSVYSPFRRAWDRLPLRAVLPAPIELRGVAGLDPGPIPSLADLGLGPPTADPASFPEPGEPAARRRLERWLTAGLAGLDGYAARRDLLGVDGSSRLSTDLRFGLLSSNEVAARAIRPGEGARTYLAELAWRDFYASLLFDRPELLRSASRPAYDAVAWRDDPAGVAAWREGRTGYPVVDAAMRQLRTTGWMPNRARMIVASFLTKDLLVDWRVGERWFMANLLDGDPASNVGGWQWSASTGADAQPWFRIFSPTLQGERFDPDGAYVRRWLPELAKVPDRFVHTPWLMPPEVAAAAGCRIGIDYPVRIVDHAAARERALVAFAVARAGEALA